MKHWKLIQSALEQMPEPTAEEMEKMKAWAHTASFELSEPQVAESMRYLLRCDPDDAQSAEGKRFTRRLNVVYPW